MSSSSNNQSNSQQEPSKVNTKSQDPAPKPEIRAASLEDGGMTANFDSGGVKKSNF